MDGRKRDDLRKQSGTTNMVCTEQDVQLEIKKMMIALQYTKRGFLCFTTDTARGQAAVAAAIRETFKHDKIVMIDGINNTELFTIGYIQRLIQNHSGAQAYVIYNLQLFAKDEERAQFFGRLNFMRDPWAREEKLFLLGMTDSFKTEMVRRAPDFNSFFFANFHFGNLLPESEKPDIHTIGNAGIITIGDMIDRNTISVSAMKYARLRFDELASEITRDGLQTTRSAQTEQLYLDVLSTWLDCPDMLQSRYYSTVSNILPILNEWSKSWEENLPNADKHTLIGNAFLRMAQYDEALESLNAAMLIREKVLGKEHPGTAESYDDVARVYYDQADYGKTLKWLEKALAIREKLLGKEHPGTAESYNNIAAIYDYQGDYDKALEWYGKASDIFEKTLRKGHPDTAFVYNNIATVYHEQSDYAQALEWYEKALAIRESVLGKDHPGTADVYNNIASVHENQGDYGRALEWYGKALAICKNILGNEHPDTIRTYNNIESIRRLQGDAARNLN
ncbi:MAG: tetratricopeptide repeat protein [Clostridiales bacterium]|jgi:tetratricopeptide (TPR) repeat protein|nr:tetratricopeptide repeat protein [Clostridiales bacterium]